MPDHGKTLVLHFGAHKTGTSLFQRYMRDKADLMAKNGVAFTLRRETDEFIDWGQADLLDEQTSAIRARIDQAFQDGNSHFVLSHENALGRPFVNGTEGLYPECAARLKNLAKVFAGYNLTLMFYIRAQHEFVESYYLQTIHEGSSELFDDWLARIDLGKLSWAPVIGTIASAFPQAKFVVKDFRQSIEKGPEKYLKDAFSAFLPIVNPAAFEGFKYGIDRNISIGDKGLRIALAVNPLLNGPEERSKMRKFLQKNFSNFDFPRPKLLTQQQQSEISSLYENENKELVSLVIPGAALKSAADNVANGLGKKNYFVGMGAQKAGTTWLHSYLNRHPQAYVPVRKELHYFDAKFHPDLSGHFDRRAIRSLVKFYLRHRENPLEASSKRNLDCIVDRVRMIHDDQAYFDHFNKNVKSAHKIYGEISPSYAMLDARALRHVQESFPGAKVIFLMRDPIERYFSAQKMRERNQWRNKPEPKPSLTDRIMQMLNPREGADDVRRVRAVDRVDTHIETEQNLRRGDYKRTIEAIESVFAPDNVFYAFYETFFRESEIRRLCDFLGTDFVDPDFSVRKNVSDVPETFSDDQFNKMYAKFEHVYEFCNERFGADVPEQWAKGKL